MKRLGMIAALFAFASVVAYAQATSSLTDPKMVQATQELGETLFSWGRTAVLPEVAVWKKQLDGAMSAEDLSQLNVLRAKASEMAKQAMDLGSSMAKAWKAENYDLMKTNRAAMKQLSTDQKALFAQLVPIAIKYHTTLEEIGKVAQPKVEAWKNDAMTKVQAWQTSHKDLLGGTPVCAGMFAKGEGLMRMLNPQMRKNIMAALFMLWDGTDFTQRAQQNMKNGIDLLNGFNLN